MDLSIIVPAYNTEKWISQCLTSLCKQNYRPDQFEVIVINDGSPDDLESIVLELQKNIPTSDILSKRMEDKEKQETQDWHQLVDVI